jgi:hypothetical protein
MAPQTWKCGFCRRHTALLPTAASGRGIKSAHFRVCPAYQSLNFLRFGILDPTPEVLERRDSLVAERRNERNRQQLDNGYMSDDSFVWAHENDPQNEEDEVMEKQFNSELLLKQLAWMTKIDNLSNKVMGVGSVSGSLSGKRKQADWEDYVIVNRLVEQLKISPTQATMVLLTFREILQRHSVEMYLPKTMRTIRERCMLLDVNSYTFEPMTFLFDNRLINTDAPAYRGATGAFLNPIEMLSEFLLTIEDNDLELEPKTVINSTTGKMEMEGYHHSAQYHKVCTVLRQLHGPEVKVICVDFNYDGMPVDGIGKRSLKPLKMRIKNAGSGLLMKKENVLTVAYGPLILNTDPELTNWMIGKVHTAGRREAALRYCKRLDLLTLINPLLTPLLTPDYAMHKNAYKPLTNPLLTPECALYNNAY